MLDSAFASSEVKELKELNELNELKKLNVLSLPMVAEELRQQSFWRSF